ncbi:MAG: VCBS repeat-containing protein, partial [Myxococcota bacterium]|nr:VCBS repeat-containing protein [Myxococcota bacterium]
MKALTSHALAALCVVTLASLVSTPTMAGERTMRHTEDFTTDAYYDESQEKELLGEGEEECAGLGCQSAHGWLEEKGYVTLSRIGQTGSAGGFNRMPAPYPAAPASPSPSVRPSQIVAGVFTRSLGDTNPATGTGADDAIALIFDPSASSLCHLHFLKNKGSAYPAFNPSTRSQSLSHKGFEVGYRVQTEPSDPLWDNYIIGATQQGTDNGEASGTWNCSSDADGELSGDNEYGVVLVAGDFNNDKWLDVLYMRASDRNREGRVDSAYVFINLQTVTNGVPNFKRYRLESQSELLKSGLSLHWSSPVGVAVKYHQSNSEQDIRNCESDGEEHDCRDDLVIASSYGSDLKVLLFKQKASPVFNTDSARIFEPPVDLGLSILMQDAATSTASVSTSTQCGMAAGVTRGITALDAADINGDGRTDIVLGGFHEQGLKYFFTNPAGFYSTAVVPFPAGGVVGVFARDWNYDGNLDLLITRTGEGCDGANVDPNQPQEKDPAGVWVVYGDPDPNDTIRSEADRFRSGDLELLASLNDQLHYGVPIQLDDDEDKYIDFLTGYNPSWGSSYYYFHSEWPKLYKTAGLVQSKRIDTWNPEEHLITQVTLEEAAIEGFSPGDGMELTFMVTNNGVDWEELTAAELPPSLRPADSGCDAESARPHKFTTFGTDLRWGLKTSVARSASLSREEQVIADTAGGATKDAPRLTYVQLLSTVVEQAHYSRSALAYGEWAWGADGKPGTKYLYSASFRYPGFVGKLKAWDITNAPREVQDGVNPGDDNPHLDAYYQWDAGEKLRLRSGSSRTFYYFTYENGMA